MAHTKLSMGLLISMLSFLTRTCPSLLSPGLAAYVHMFAGPQDPEEVKPDTRTRLFKNPELKLQCRLTTETRTEKCVGGVNEHLLQVELSVIWQHAY